MKSATAIAGAPIRQGRPITAPLRPALMIERRDVADSADVTDSAEPIDKIDAADPIDPIDATDPTEPIDSSEPRQPIHSNESSDHSDHLEFMPAYVTRHDKMN